MSEVKSFREASKTDWGFRDSRNATNDELQLGAILRIADASEKMASNYTRLQDDLDWYKKRCAEHREVIAQRDRQIANLRGQITKLKKKMQ